jgi:hypothetical protein
LQRKTWPLSPCAHAVDTRQHDDKFLTVIAGSEVARPVKLFGDTLPHLRQHLIAGLMAVKIVIGLLKRSRSCIGSRCGHTFRTSAGRSILGPEPNAGPMIQVGTCKLLAFDDAGRLR